MPERLKSIKKAFKSKNEVIIVSEDNGEVIGFGHFKIYKNKIGWIEKEYIKASFRKRGIATKIIQKGLKWFKKMKINNIRAAIFVNNNPSSKLIKKSGFNPRHIVWEKVK